MTPTHHSASWPLELCFWWPAAPCRAARSRAHRDVRSTTASLENCSEFAAVYWACVTVLNPARSVFGVAGESDNESDENVVEQVTPTYCFFELVQLSYRTTALTAICRRCFASASIAARTVDSPVRHATSEAIVRPARVSDSQTK